MRDSVAVSTPLLSCGIVGSNPAPASIYFYRKGECLTEGSNAITSTAFKSVIDAVTAQISVTSVVEVLAYAVPICIGLVFMWWGVRKVTRMIMGAFRKGKLRP